MLDDVLNHHLSRVYSFIRAFGCLLFLWGVIGNLRPRFALSLEYLHGLGIVIDLSLGNDQVARTVATGELHAMTTIASVLPVAVRAKLVLLLLTRLLGSGVARRVAGLHRAREVEA